MSTVMHSKMTTEDKMKAIRSGIDEAKQYIDEYGVAGTIVYVAINLKGEDVAIWLMAIAEWQEEHP